MSSNIIVGQSTTGGLTFEQHADAVRRAHRFTEQEIEFLHVLNGQPVAEVEE